MSKITQIVSINYEGTLKLSESEMRALEALAGYGTENFLKVFYEHMGKSYLSPHEHGLRELFDKVEKIVKPQLFAIDDARRVLGHKS